jgi:hypothetical protein
MYARLARVLMAIGESNERFHIALGMAAAKLWSNLPQPLQQELFDAAVSFRGGALRQPLAVFLHERHERTTDALKEAAIQEPDSPGG